MQVGIRQLARAESRVETGGNASQTALDVIGNIDAMQLAVDEAANTPSAGLTHLREIHAKLMANASNSQVGGRRRASQNRIGGNDHNLFGADFIPPPPEHVEPLLFETIHPLELLEGLEAGRPPGLR